MKFSKPAFLRYFFAVYTVRIAKLQSVWYNNQDGRCSHVSAGDGRRADSQFAFGERLEPKGVGETDGAGLSQLSRIESRETKNISSDILVKLAKDFYVSREIYFSGTAARGIMARNQKIDMIQKIKAALPNKPQEQITADGVAAVTSQIGQAIVMDEETVGAFQSFVKQMFERSKEI